MVANLAVKQMTLASAIFAQAIISDLKLEKIATCPFFIVVKELKLIQRTFFICDICQTIYSSLSSLNRYKKEKEAYQQTRRRKMENTE